MFSQNPISKNLILNILICFIPITYIAGNLVLNLNILLFLMVFFGSFHLKIFRFKLNKVDKLILIFFLYVFLNGVINNYFNFNHENEKNVILYKTLAYMRFLILYFSFRYLISNNLLRNKLIFFSFGLTALFVSLDIIYQFFFRVDIFGFEALTSDRRLAGPFGDEWVAGSFIQRFYIFLIFFFLLFYKFKNKWNFHLVNYLILFLFALGVIMSGNRIPVVMFFLSLFFLIIFEKSLRKNFLVGLFILFSFAFIFGKSSENIKLHYTSFITKSFEVFDYLNNKYSTSMTEKNITSNSYINEFESGISTWKQNKIFGGGIKSFYYNCAKRSTINSNLPGCSSHPHNYYIQIAAELGLAGLALIIVIFSFIFFKTLKILFFEKGFVNKELLIPFFILFIVEVFPLKTTGSFFTTTNATFLFILIPFIVGLSELKKVK